MFDPALSRARPPRFGHDATRQGEPRMNVSPLDLRQQRFRTALRGFDKVAYIRFASVYRQFEDVRRFQRELSRLVRERPRMGKKLRTRTSKAFKVKKRFKKV